MLQYEIEKRHSAGAAATSPPPRRSELQCMPFQLSWPAKQARLPSRRTHSTAVLAALAADTPTGSLTSSTAPLAAKLLRGRCAGRSPCSEARRQEPRRRAAGLARAGAASQQLGLQAGALPGPQPSGRHGREVAVRRAGVTARQPPPQRGAQQQRPLLARVRRHTPAHPAARSAAPRSNYTVYYTVYSGQCSNQ